MQDELINIDENFVNQYLSANLNKVIVEGREMLKPPPDILPSQWADDNRYYSESSPIPGKCNLQNNTPHLIGMLDATADPRVRQISIMASSQIGKTDGFLNNYIGYKICNDPCYMIIMQPTDADARDYSTQKLDPMIEETPAVKARVSKSRAKDKDNSTLRKKFTGGYLTIISAYSKSATRMKSAPVTIGDDIDGIELNQKEGDPVTRLIKRSTAFEYSLNINVSTPTLDDSSRIQKLYNQSNQMKFYVRCPHCGVQQYLKWENLHWEKDLDAFDKVIKHHLETVRYCCEGCGTLLTEGERKQMLRLGEWIADRPYITDHIGFWINELSSTLSSMYKVAKAIVDAGDDPEKLEALYNTVFGLPYKKIESKETDPIKLMDLVEDFIDPNNVKLPNEVLVLTAAVDVQRGSGDKPARLEIEVWGWGPGRERWLCYKHIIPGNIKKREETWDKLDEFWERKWYRKDGIELKIKRKFVDSGDEHLQVYEYCRGRDYENIFAIKGSNKYGASVLPRDFSIVDNGRTKLLSLGTQAAKAEIFGCLHRINLAKDESGKYVKSGGPKYTHFPKAFCDSEYFKQLTAEHGVTKAQGMVTYTVYEKKKKGLANEALDLFVYNLAAMEHISPNFEAIKRNIDAFLETRNVEAEEKPEVQEIKPASKIRRKDRRNNYLNSWRN